MRYAFLIVLLTIFSFPAIAADKDVYDRVMKTGVIECGYFIEPPFTMKDEATGEYSGISVELIEQIAKDLGLKVKWKEQISFATFPQDLNNNRYDMVCGSIFVMPRAGAIDYTKAYSYASMYGYVKPEDTAFDKKFKDIDWSKVTIAGLDGEGATGAAQKLLPQARMNVLPQLSNISEMLLTVATGKSDIGFVLPSVFDDFNKANPNKLKKASLDKPLYTYEVTFGIAREQDAFKSMINNGIRQLSTSGELASIFEKYDPKHYFDYPQINKQAN